MAYTMTSAPTYLTWTTSTGTTAYTVRPTVEQYNERFTKQQVLEQAKEEMDNFLEDYLEELRASDEDTISIIDVVKALEKIQKDVSAGIGTEMRG